jgi:microcystin-dependent protein
MSGPWASTALGDDAVEPFVGQIIQVGFNFVPTGFAACDGSLLPINQNQALFALLGTTYGGDGMATFAVPDLKAADEATGLHSLIAIAGIFPSRG